MIEGLRKLFRRVEPVGSAYTVSDPDFKPQDIDYVCLTAYSEGLAKAMKLKGWTLCGVVYPDDTVIAMRSGEYNILIVCDIEVFDKFILARDVCKELNLRDKWHRVVVHRAIMDNIGPREVSEV